VITKNLTANKGVAKQGFSEQGTRQSIFIFARLEIKSKLG
jgi:hypothetical protein